MTAQLKEIIAQLQPDDNFAQQAKLARKIKKIDLTQASLKPIKVAFLSTSTVDHFIDILKLYLVRDGFLPEFYISEYDTIFQTALDPNSSLYGFSPDIVWLFTNHRDLDFDTLNNSETDETVLSEIERFNTISEAIQRNCSAQIIQNNADLPLNRVFGNFESSLKSSYNSQLLSYNSYLPLNVPSNVHIFDLAYIASSVGLKNWIDEAYWHHSKHAFSLNVVGSVAHAASRMICGLKGQAYKCLVLDLDNTMWGGVIGDDGMDGIRLGQGNAEGEAFLAFQRYVHSLSQRGVILTVCSKNEDIIAREAFENHPEMAIKISDIAVFVCNWINKADNIRAIADTLEIGLDSFVFIDDNPAERAQVKSELPMVCVPDLPEDPALYGRTLDQALCFETISFSDEDRKRGAMYQGNAQRKSLKTNFSDLSSFLNNLRMTAEVSDFGPVNLPRISQLINKSNQFHLTTTRYSTTEIEEMLSQDAYTGVSFRLKDRFGDNGLISGVLLHQIEDILHIDTWVMSCRVLSRGMEDLICNEIVSIAQKIGVKIICGHYIPTKKNMLVKGLYERLGWLCTEKLDNGTQVWQIALEQAKERKHYIERDA